MASTKKFTHWWTKLARERSSNILTGTRNDFRTKVKFFQQFKAQRSSRCIAISQWVASGEWTKQLLPLRVTRISLQKTNRFKKVGNTDVVECQTGTDRSRQWTTTGRSALKCAGLFTIHLQATQQLTITISPTFARKFTNLQNVTRNGSRQPELTWAESDYIN